MAKKALDEHKFLWRVKPKLHLLCHMFSSPRFINQSFYSTWMDEDYLKKVGKTLSLTPMKTAQKRLLQRWCLSIPKNLEKTLSWPCASWQKNWESGPCEFHGRKFHGNMVMLWKCCFLVVVSMFHVFAAIFVYLTFHYLNAHMKCELCWFSLGWNLMLPKCHAFTPTHQKQKENMKTNWCGSMKTDWYGKH